MSDLTKLGAETPDLKAPGDQRQPGGDATRSSGTHGARFGLSGAERGGLIASWVIGISVTTMVILMNIANRRQMLPQEPPAAAWVDEFTSLAALGLAYLAPLLAVVAVRRRGRRLLTSTPLVLAALVAFVGVHIGVASLLRVGLYPLLVGRPHGLSWLRENGAGEAAKDLAIFGVAFWTAYHVLAWRASGQGPKLPAAPPDTFDIHDGPRLIRVAIGDILAVRSAGNYAEFLLSDGRRPLMRASLAGLEAGLAPLGFVRTHRSWLVNAARVTGLKPQGSGDYAVELGAVDAPLSRRFPDALAAIRSGHTAL